MLLSPQCGGKDTAMVSHWFNKQPLYHCRFELFHVDLIAKPSNAIYNDNS